MKTALRSVARKCELDKQTISEDNRKRLAAKKFVN